MRDAGVWWGRHEVGTGRRIHWKIGALDLWVECLAHEWRVAHREDPDRLRDALQGSRPSADMELPEDVPERRFATDPSDDVIELRPQLADRPMVVRPDATLGLVTGGSVAVYVSTPVWVEILSGRGKELFCVPTVRPSDTWFGDSTRSGELCYSGRTTARLHLDELIRRPGRVLTKILVHNEGPDVLTIERVQIPAPHLDLYADASGMLWTQTVSVTRSQDDAVADVDIAKGAPEAAGKVTRVASARTTGTPSMVVRALGALLF